MPYYVYAIHLDAVSCDLFKICETYKEAQELEVEKKAARVTGANHVVRMFHAENNELAEEKAISLALVANDSRWS